MADINNIKQHIGLRDASFYIRIIYRQSANWQGEIYWLEADKKRRFRSTLELVALMQEAMDEAGFPGADYTLRSWNDLKKKEEIFCVLSGE